MELSQRNRDRIANWVKRQPRHRDVPLYVERTLIKNFDQNRAILCGFCYSYPLLPIVLPCNHLVCNYCYQSNFEANNYRLGNDFCTRCPYCKANINHDHVLTIKQEVELHPNSIISNYYSQAEVYCDNEGCNKLIKLSNLYEHLKYECEYRMVPCAAAYGGCPIVDDLIDVTAHSLSCPFHYTWCAICNEEYSIISTGHNCEKAIERQRIMKRELITEEPCRQHGDICIFINIVRHLPDIETIRAVSGLIQVKREQIKTTSFDFV